MMMFQKLINLLNNGKTYSQYELSKEMGVSTETLQGFIEYLSEKGFLVPIETQKDIDRDINKCSKCTGCTRCSGTNPRLRTPDFKLKNNKQYE